jgi:CheY-like chemotaxis protein
MNDFGGIRVLVVEPDSWVRVLLTDLFKSEGAEVLSAIDLEGALACADGLKPHILITNYLLADGMTGQNLAVALRKINELLGLVFVSKLPEEQLALGPSADSLSGSKYCSAGPDFSVSALLDLVASVLSGVPSK